MSAPGFFLFVLGLLLAAGCGYYAGRSRTALSALAQAGVDSATGAAAADLSSRQQAIEVLVSPLRDALSRVQHQLQTSERDRLSASAALDEHLSAMRLSSEGLRSETAQLVTALRAPQVRGRWGELQLERVVEAAGLVEHVDYVTQESIPGPDGTVRPDLVIHLVGGKHVVVDSKVAFSGYLEAMEARDELVRQTRLRAHARQLRAHIEQLASKQYWSKFTNTPEFVVCFIPADAFLDAALREDPGLLELGFDRNVIIATPSTLVALLRTVSYTWRQDALAHNSAAVSQLGRDLYHRLTTMTGHLDKLGRSLATSVAAFNSTVATMEGRVLVSARRLAELSVVDATTAGALDSPDQVLLRTRSPTADTLTS